MEKVVPIGQLSLGKRLKRLFKQNKTNGPDTDGIRAVDLVLEQRGWVIDYCDSSLPEMSACVRYETKTIAINIHKAYHARITLERIRDVLLSGQPTGRYFYQWEDGEKMIYDPPVEERDHWFCMYLTVKRID